MPARCPSCGEEALTETARFCVACGGSLPEQEPHVVLSEMVVDDAPLLQLPTLGDEPPPAPAQPPAPQPQPPAASRDDTPRFAPRPAPSRAATVIPPPPKQPVVRMPRPTMPPVHDQGPVVPLSLVIAGVIGLLALLLLLLLAA